MKKKKEERQNVMSANSATADAESETVNAANTAGSDQGKAIFWQLFYIGDANGSKHIDIVNFNCNQ